MCGGRDLEVMQTARIELTTISSGNKATLKVQMSYHPALIALFRTSKSLSLHLPAALLPLPP